MERHILKTLKAEVLKLNEPTVTGRIYTTDCITNALEDPILKERLEHRALFGGREVSLEADIISCNKCHECSFYKEKSV